MKVENVRNNLAFGRALSAKEKKEYTKTINEAKQTLGTGKTTATVFDFSIPSSKNNTGIGTSFSDDAQKMAEFLSTMCGVNSIQLQPQGEISNHVRSPYSGTSFSLGSHIIDLNKLTSEEYGKLLAPSDLKTPFTTRVKDDRYVDYDNIFADDGQRAMLKKAYTRFEKLDESDPLKKEFENFKHENSYWLERDALFEAAATENGTKDVKQWSERDKNIYAHKTPDYERIEELKHVQDENGMNVVDFEEFVQFIADKEQKEAKANFNNKGIEIYGDCQIGFSSKDVWAHKNAFYPNYEFGCDIGGGQYSCWSPAIDFSKLDGEAGELLSQKFDLFFRRYDGVRIDAAWQLIDPIICETIKENGKDKYDKNGNKLGRRLDNQPRIKNGGREIIENIILKAADKNNVPHDKVFLELLGGNSYNTLDTAKSLGTELIHITRYGGDSWGRVKYYESQGDNKYQNMRPGQYIIGPGTHDDTSLIEQAENGQSRAEYLSGDLKVSCNELKNSSKKMADAIFAELFTTKNQFATLPDILGSRRRINTPNTKQGNWSYRSPQNYEEYYHKNLSQNKGLNLPDALSKAIKAKQNGGKNTLTDKLDYFAEILRQDGPMTEKEANKADYIA